MTLLDIKKNKKTLDVIFKENNVVLAYLFGSAAKDKMGPLSDIDIAVLFSKKVRKDNYFDLRIKIAGEIDRLLKTDKTEVVCLNNTPPILRYEAIYKGTNIYCSDIDNRRSFEFRVLQDYEDFKYYLDTASNIMKKQIKNNTFGKPLIHFQSEYLEKYVSSK